MQYSNLLGLLAGRSRVMLFGAAIAIAVGACSADMGPSAETAATHPDFTGVWGTYREPGQEGRGRRGAVPDLPIRPEAQARVDAYEAIIAPSGDTPGGYCLGYGMPGDMLSSGGYPMEIVQHDDVIAVIYEAHAEIRHIYIGSTVPEEDLFPDRNGYSVGHWDGDKLIVETTHLKDAVDQRQYPHSDQAKVIEEYELTTGPDGNKVLVANMTMTDPVFYTEPVKAEKKWTFLPGTRLLPYECNEPRWEEHLDELREQQAGEK